MATAEHKKITSTANSFHHLLYSIFICIKSGIILVKHTHFGSKKALNLALTLALTR